MRKKPHVVTEWVSACGPEELSHGRMPSPLCEHVLPPWKQINPVTPALSYFKVLTFTLSLSCWGKGNLRVAVRKLWVFQVHWDSKAG